MSLTSPIAISNLTEKIESAVDCALRYGISVEKFKAICAEMWEEVLRKKLQYDLEDWKKK